jgi:hypothetical protein
MDFSLLDRQLLARVFKSKQGLLLKGLKTFMGLSEEEINNSIKKLQGLGFLMIMNDRVFVTDAGSGYVITTQFKMNQKKDRSQSEFLQDFMGKQIGINEFYIPQNFKK